MEYLCLECGQFYEGDEMRREHNICPDCERQLHRAKKGHRDDA